MDKPGIRLPGVDKLGLKVSLGPGGAALVYTAVLAELGSKSGLEGTQQLLSMG